MPEKAAVLSRTSIVLYGDSSDRFTFYPAYCYKDSPTWFAWVRLSAYHIHNGLQSRRTPQTAPTFLDNDNKSGPNQTLLLFYLNHPVQFVQLVGVVVTLEDYFEKFWLFTLDDSSGATVDINCRKPDKLASDKQEHESSEKARDQEAEARWQAMTEVDIGVVVQVKGQIQTFRNIRQIQLDRISIIRETNEEMRLISARTTFYDDVLSHPWELSTERQQKLRERALGESKDEEGRIRRRQKVTQLKMERETRHAARIAAEYEREERKREESARTVRAAALRMKDMKDV